MPGVAPGTTLFTFFKKESAYGTPVTPDIYLPVSNYGLAFNPDNYNTEMKAGHWQRRAKLLAVRHRLAGPIACDAYGYFVNSGSNKSIFQHILDGVMNRTSHEPESFTFEKADTNETSGGKQHAGVTFNQITIAGSDEGDGVITLALDCVGKNELSNAPTALADGTPGYVPFVYADTLFNLNSATFTPRSFQMVIANNQVHRFNNSRTVSYVRSTARLVDIQFVFDKDSDDYDIARRQITPQDPVALEIILKGDHQGTGSNNFTRLTLTMEEVVQAQVAEAEARTDLWSHTLNLQAVKPTNANDELEYAFDTVD
jgi:hypothetical protein